MIVILSAMDFMASTVCLTERLLSLASRAPLDAACAVCRPLSAVCSIEAPISSSAALVSSTAADCCDVPCDSSCAVPLTCPAAERSASAELRTSPTIPSSRSTIAAMTASRLSRSPERSAIVTSKRPSATWRATAAACAGSPPSCRTTLLVARVDTTAAASAAITITSAERTMACRAAAAACW